MVHGALEEVLAAEMFMRDRAVAAACGIRCAVGLTIDQGRSPSGARECFKSLVSSGGGGKEAELDPAAHLTATTETIFDRPWSGAGAHRDGVQVGSVSSG